MDGDGAKGAAADAQHHEGFRFLADPGSSLLDPGYDLLLIMGQLPPLELGPLVRHGLEGVVQRQGLDLVGGEPVGDQGALHHVVVVDLQAHALAPGGSLVILHDKSSQ